MKTLALLACETDKILFVDVDSTIYTKIFSELFSKRRFRNYRYISDLFKNILFIIVENHEKKNGVSRVSFRLIVCRGNCIGGKVYLKVKI